MSGEGYVATCWHVVKSSTGQIVVKAGADSLYDLERGNIFSAMFYMMTGGVVAHDETADVAILRVDRSPFKAPPPVIVKMPDREITARYGLPSFKEELPRSGQQVLLAGYPLGRPDLLSQAGNVAGIGLVGESQDPASTYKLVRIFLSVISNPANSGGPVLNDSGELIGLLKGNLPSPMRDEQGRDVLYVRPQLNESGAPVLDQHGKPQLEVANLNQNSRISVAKFGL